MWKRHVVLGSSQILTLNIVWSNCHSSFLQKWFWSSYLNALRLSSSCGCLGPFVTEAPAPGWAVSRSPSSHCHLMRAPLCTELTELQQSPASHIRAHLLVVWQAIIAGTQHCKKTSQASRTEDTQQRTTVRKRKVPCVVFSPHSALHRWDGGGLMLHNDQLGRSNESDMN